jgi:hypothetical protein
MNADLPTFVSTFLHWCNRRVRQWATQCVCFYLLPSCVPWVWFPLIFPSWFLPPYSWYSYVRFLAETRLIPTWYPELSVALPTKSRERSHLILGGHLKRCWGWRSRWNPLWPTASWGTRGRRAISAVWQAWRSLRYQPGLLLFANIW